jgi:hypothetical protein
VSQVRRAGQLLTVPSSPLLLLVSGDDRQALPRCTGNAPPPLALVLNGLPTGSPTATRVMVVDQGKRRM